MARIDTTTERHLQFLRRHGKHPDTLAIYRCTYRQFIWFTAKRRIYHLPRLSAELLEVFQEALTEPGVPIFDEENKKLQAAKFLPPAAGRTR